MSRVRIRLVGAVGLLLLLISATLPARAAGADDGRSPGATRADCEAIARDLVATVRHWDTTRNQRVVFDKSAVERLVVPLPDSPMVSGGPAAAAAYLATYLYMEDGVVPPMRTGREVALYERIKQFAATDPNTFLDYSRILELSLDAVSDGSTANIQMAMLTAHNVVRVLARPQQWVADVTGPSPVRGFWDSVFDYRYGHPRSDPMTPIFDDVRGLTPGSLGEIMASRNLSLDRNAANRTEYNPEWTNVLFRPGVLFAPVRGATHETWIGGAHYYFWVGALGNMYLTSVGTDIARRVEQSEKDKFSDDSSQQGALQLTYFGCGADSAQAFYEQRPGMQTGSLSVTAVEVPGAAINNAPPLDMTVAWQGNATFPVTLTLRPRTGWDCPQGNCMTVVQTYDSPANPFVLVGGAFCYGYPESCTFVYEVVLTDSAGHTSPPFPTNVECVVPK
jgi:hypothetical protein